jgi:hypothetical protein
MHKDLARKAAKWWADHMRQGFLPDNGARDKSNVMAQGLALMLQEQEAKKRTAEGVQLFEDKLTNIFENVTAQTYYLASVDYNPCRTLEEAAKQAGIHLGMASLPWKTSMTYRDEKVYLKAGYGAPFEELK